MESDIKEMYEKLCKELSDYPSGVDQFKDLRRIANKIGFKVENLHRGKDYVSDSTSGRYEVWIEIPGCSNLKDGYGDSLPDAVKNAVSNCFLMNRIYNEKV